MELWHQIGIPLIEKIQQTGIKSVQWKPSKLGMAKEALDEENDEGRSILVFYES